MAKRPATGSRAKAPAAPAAQPAPPVLPPHLDPRFEGVNKGLTLTKAHFDKLISLRCFYDAKAADHAVLFFERYARHAKGEWAGKPLKLEPWQEYHTRNIFGWKRPDGTRVFRIVYCEVPRKNGKSTWISGIADYLLTADKEPGAEVYSAANDRDQAAIVFDTAAQMVKKSPELAKRCKVLRRAITVPQLGASYKVLSADVKNKDGFNSHGVLFDELHKQKTRELWDVLVTSTGSRRQPLVVAITTAGFDQHSICWEQHEYSRKVAEGVFEDFQHYPIIYCAAKEDDWKSPDVWKKANPNYGVSVKESSMREACKKAENDPAFENTFRRNHLNQWTAQKSRWMPMAAWDACGGPVDAAALAGLECFGGLDLASTIDIAALLLVFPTLVDTEDGEAADTFYKLLPYFWIPKENIEERVKRDGVRYDLWEKEGLLRTTPGNIIDFDFILKDIDEIRKTFVLRELAFDRWGAVRLEAQLTDLGITMVPFGQGFASMSAPCKEFLRLTLGGKIAHGGNKVLRWMADNAVAKQDAAGNVKLDKAKSSQKIDGMVAAVMGLDRALRHRGPGGSVYESRGFVSIGGAA